MCSLRSSCSEAPERLHRHVLEQAGAALPPRQEGAAVEGRGRHSPGSSSRPPSSARNLDAAYTIVHPDLKGTLTRKQWDTGNIPVISYPARQRGHGGLPGRLQLQDLGAARESTCVAKPGTGPAPAAALLPRPQARGRQADRPLARELLAAALEASGAAGRRLSRARAAVDCWNLVAYANQIPSCRSRFETRESGSAAPNRILRARAARTVLDRGAEVAVHGAVGDRGRLHAAGAVPRRSCWPPTARPVETTRPARRPVREPTARPEFPVRAPGQTKTAAAAATTRHALSTPAARRGTPRADVVETRDRPRRLHQQGAAQQAGLLVRVDRERAGRTGSRAGAGPGGPTRRRKACRPAEARSPGENVHNVQVSHPVRRHRAAGVS